MNIDRLNQNEGSPRRGPTRLTGAVALALASVAMAGPAHAQRAPDPVTNDSAPPSGQFETPDGSLRFVLDRSGPMALIQFEGDPEVYVLRPDPTMGAGGQQFFRTGDGSIVVRVTRWGEITLFVRNDRMGAAASFAESAPPLRPQPVPAPAFQQEWRQTERAVVQRVGRAVALEAPAQMGAGDGAVILDAAERAVDGLAAAPQTPIRRVRIQVGQAPAAAVQGDMLIIVVVPSLGYAGRPSSEQIRAALAARR
jgi:hypothetical protein